MACVTTFVIEDISTSDDCFTKGGIKVAGWTKDSNINWDATLSNPALFTAATQTLHGYAMNAGAVWNWIKFKRKGSNYTQAYTSDNSSYDINITNYFEGKGSALRNALVNALRGCKIIYHCFDNNCSSRMFGKDYDGDTFIDMIEPMIIRSHDDVSGDVGGDKPSDTVVFGGEGENSAIYTDISLTDFTATYV